MATRTAPPARRSHGTVNTANVLLVIIGVIILLASQYGLLWYSVDTTKGFNVAGTGFTFTDLRANTAKLSAPVAGAYFDWLAVTLLVAVGIVGIAANLPTPLSDPLRVLGFLLGSLGVVGTFYALAQLFTAQHAAGGSSHSVWHNSSFGTWAAFAGF
ncbi:MAG: hypothetical protein M3Y06_02345, partial [Actinomycetota bacterium]|nr:hypothetical protein [Actinomycetota bacterium]